MTSTLGVALLLTAAATLYKAVRHKRQAAEVARAAQPNPPLRRATGACRCCWAR
jgi:hypothetical protein